REDRPQPGPAGYRGPGAHPRIPRGDRWNLAPRAVGGGRRGGRLIAQRLSGGSRLASLPKGARREKARREAPAALGSVLSGATRAGGTRSAPCQTRGLILISSSDDKMPISARWSTG